MSALRVLAVLAAFFALGAGAALCAEVPVPASPTQWVTDTAGFLSTGTVAQLNARLRAYQHATGHQVLVYVAPTTGDTPLEDWTVRAFHAWKIGRKGLDDGLVLFIFPNDHKLRIEVGYGLESTIPDALAARIIRETITPQLHANQPDQAVTAGVDRILGAIGGEANRPAEAAAPAQTEGSSADTISLAGIIAVFLGFLGVFVLIWFFAWRFGRNQPTHISGSSGESSSHSFWSSSSDSSSTSSSDDDDFSGGGGDSGGGGASGSW